MQNIKLYDTTLRDGAQAEGISYSVLDKLRITKELDKIGVHYIEGGWPGSNPKDMEFFKEVKKIKLVNSQVAAFSMTRRPNILAKDDANIMALVDSGAKIITIVGKSWDFHVTEVLKTTLEENLNMIKDTVSFLKSNGLTVFYDAEHFFDAYKANKDYALKTLLAAVSGGAEVICLCDTNGGSLPSEIERIIKEIKFSLYPPFEKGGNGGILFGIHCHNDAGVAIANSIVAIEAGCEMVQGTINGYGERCGNADLISIIANLKLKMGIDCVSDLALKELTHLSHFISEISNMRVNTVQPFIGDSAFAHKGGMHINAIMKDPRTYEHIDPSLVGNKRRVLVSELGGKTGILLRAKALNYDLGKENEQTKKILKLVQTLEHQGYQFEAAEASFKILMEKALKKHNKFFTLESFRVVVEKQAKNKITTEAIIKLSVKGKKEHTVAFGDGPVNALDNALRKALKEFYPQLAKMHLSDFKVRVLDGKEGTAAKVRVLIESQDQDDAWSTVGVSENIIEASWQALVDSVEYKLMKDKVK